MNIEDLNKRAFRYLELNTFHYPRTKVISELNLILDRAKFSPELQDFFSTPIQNLEKAKETLTFLFKPEVSEPIFKFLNDLAENGILEVLTEANGKNFIAHCESVLYETKEIFFNTAVDLSKEFKEYVASQVESLYGNQVRIVFEANPYIIAGFVLQEDKNVFDYSFKTNFLYNLRMYYQDKVKK